MPGTNLTREEAQTRAGLLDVESYTVDLDLTVSDTVFGCTTVLRFTCREPGASTFADLVGATSARSPSTAPTSTRSRSTPTAASAWPASRRTTSWSSAELPYSRTGEGLHRFVDPADGRVYLYTQFEVPDARRVYTTFEQPDLKSVFTFTVTAPEGWTVISNAATPEPRPSSGDAGPLGVPATERMSTYITAIVAGEYHAVHDVYAGPHGTSRSATSAGSRWSRTSTSTSCSRSPSRASRSSRRPSTTPTRSASTTRPTCRSTTWARWRTPAA